MENGVRTNGQNNNIYSYDKKLKLDQSGNHHQKVNTTTLASAKNQRKPLFSLIPDKMNKNANTSSQLMKSNQTHDKRSHMMDQGRRQASNERLVYSHKQAVEHNNVLFCEESELFQVTGGLKQHFANLQGTQQSSQLQLTPQKTLPIPISPTSRPILSNTSSVSNNIKQQQQEQNIFNQQQQQRSDGKPQGNKGSGQKAIVVYDEFKYYTSAMSNKNMINMISKNGTSGSFTNNKKNESGQYICEFLHSEGQMFDNIASPKESTDKQGRCSLKKYQNNVATYNTNSDHGMNHIQRNNSLPQKQESLPFSASDYGRYKQEEQDLRRVAHIDEEMHLSQGRGRNFETMYEQKIQLLQEHVEQLEKDLRTSKDKNQEIQKKFKDKSFIQSFDKNMRHEKTSVKHLSDTEDSLILSEKKKKRNSLQSKLNSHNQSSSIVDARIKQISNLQQINTDRYNQVEFLNNNNDLSISEEEEVELYCCQRNSNQQVASKQNSGVKHRIYLNDLDKDTNEDQCEDNDNEDQDEQDQLNSVDSQDCESCERLKQLVFQAKEAIDDLKMEIDEWREIAAAKETELRALQHKIYNDLRGIDKNVGFDDVIQTKEFESEKPVNSEANKIKNFIMHNKKKLRSRSKNTHQSTQNTDSQNQKGNKNVSSSRKKSALKKAQDIMSDEDIQFYHAEDQCVQTSFTDEVQNYKCNDQEESQNNNNILNSASPLKPRALAFRSRQNSNPLNQLCFNESNLLNSEKKNVILKENNNPQHLTKVKEAELEKQLVSQQENIDFLNNKNMNLEQELIKFKSQVAQLSKSNDVFANLVTKIKRKNKTNKAFQVNIDEIKQNYQIMSQLESYSILEKINDWKKEEGIQDLHSELPICRIPRPTKLIHEIDEAEVNQMMQKLMSQHEQLVNNENKFDINSIIKKEKLQLQQMQDQKYDELLKYQNDYLQSQIKSTLSYNSSSTTKMNQEYTSTTTIGKQDTVMAAVDSFIKREMN